MGRYSRNYNVKPWWLKEEAMPTIQQTLDNLEKHYRGEKEKLARELGQSRYWAESYRLQTLDLKDRVTQLKEQLSSPPEDWKLHADGTLTDEQGRRWKRLPEWCPEEAPLRKPWFGKLDMWAGGVAAVGTVGMGIWQAVKLLFLT